MATREETVQALIDDLIADYGGHFTRDDGTEEITPHFVWVNIDAICEQETELREAGDGDLLTGLAFTDGPWWQPIPD